MIPIPADRPARERAAARRRRVARAVAVAVAVPSIAWSAGLAWANSREVCQRLRARAENALRQRLPEARLGHGAAVDALGRLVLGPLTVPSGRRGAPPVVRVERVAVRPSWLALLAGRAEPGAISLEEVRVEAGPAGDEMVSLSRRLRPARRGPAGGALARATPVPEIRFAGLTVALGDAGTGRVSLGPLSGSISPPRGPGEGLRARLRLPSGGRVDLDLLRRDDRLALHLDADGVRAGDLPGALLAPLAFGVGQGEARVSLDSDDLASGANAAVEVRELVLVGERLGRDGLGPFHLAIRGALRWDPASGRVSLTRGQAALGPQGELRLAVEAAAALDPDPAFSLEIGADGVDFGALARALPEALVPAETRRLAGPVTARLALAGPMHRPSEWEVAAELDLRALRRALQRSDRLGFAGPFSWQPPAAEGALSPVWVGPANPDFVPLAELPSHLVRAVTTSEDAGFFAHSGFDFEEMRVALAQGVVAGRVVRGASTITQQLAKNLLLSAERTVARKIREAVLTVALEASLPKTRLLEIYLNIAEWGPGLHGVGPAARHYFGRDARALTPRQAAFLASVIPRPARFHAHYARGEMPDGWAERVDGILLRMAAFGQLSDGELERALGEPLVFARG